MSNANNAFHTFRGKKKFKKLKKNCKKTVLAISLNAFS